MKNIVAIKKDFPVLNQLLDHKKIVYLDSTATALKPNYVISKINDYYQKYTANVFRGIYKLSETATTEYENARQKIADFIGAGLSNEVIFTRNTSESINLVAKCWVEANLKVDDEIITTIAEHHSNFVPWQQLQNKKNIKLKIWYFRDDGVFYAEDLQKLLTKKTKFVAITALSNVLGTIVEINEISKMIKDFNPRIKILIDAAQLVPHMKINLRNLQIDFLAFSGHKMMGPTGIGILWGRHELLTKMEPYQYGGDMIKEVHLDQTIFNEIPHKFEAGTPHIAGAIGLGAAVDYLNTLGIDNIRLHEQELTKYALKKMSIIKNLKIYGPQTSNQRGGVISFSMKNIHPHDIAQILNEDNICIRVGFHCAQPLHDYLKSGPTARASFYIYNDISDIDSLVEGLFKVQKVFK